MAEDRVRELGRGRELLELAAEVEPKSSLTAASTSGRER